MTLEVKIKSVKSDFLTDLDTLHEGNIDLPSLRKKYIARNGLVADLFKMLSQVSREDRPKYGQLLNELKNNIVSKIESLSTVLEDSDSLGNIDIALPGRDYDIGTIHILEQTLNDIKRIFNDIGFCVEYGPEVDDDYHNFGALNFPEHHPARDMQDTFFIDKDIVLRTHTSNVQIHLMEENEPPLRFIVHQVEGLFVDKNVSFGQLKGCLEYFVKKMFGEKCKMRWRPSYFPFTEPSAEVDIWDDQRKQWMEILGCGMVDPEVFNNVGYDSKVWHGYAFGMGVERIAMLKHNIDDIRLFYNGDIRFLRQFK